MARNCTLCGENLYISSGGKLYTLFYRLHRYLNTFEEPKFFVISTSYNPDNAALWYNYSKNEGYNIEFNLKRFVDIINNNSIYNFGIVTGKLNKSVNGVFLFDEVYYDIKKQTSIIISILDYFTDLIRSVNNEKMYYTYETLTIHQLLICSAFFKHNYFQSEGEFRFLINVHNGVDNSLNFRTTNGVIIPYIEVGFEYGSQNQFPINSICIGPKNYSEIAETGLRIFLNNNNYYEIDIKNSNGPLRF